MFNIPWRRKSDGPARPAAEPPPSDADRKVDPVSTIYAARQPILTRDSLVHGYELLFRSTAENRFDGSVDSTLASASTIERSTTVFGLDALVGNHLAFVNLTRDALLEGHYEILPKERTVLELLETIEPDADVIAACRTLKARGWRVALDDFTDSPQSRPFLDVVDTVKVDLRGWPRGYEPAAVAPLRQRGLRLLAEKVETPAEHARASDAGYDYFQGYYYCKPQMIEARDLSPAKLSVLRFMAEVSREDVSFDQLEALFRQDLGLSVRLLRYLNSAAFGWRHEIPTLSHALSLMGARPLRQWALMMGMISLADDRPRSLVVNALSRARFAERIAPPVGLEAHKGEAFLTGMLSLMDTIVGRPMTEVLTGMSLPPTVRDALLEGSTPLGPVLALVTSYERGDWPAVQTSQKQYGVDARAIDEAYVDSIEWAEAAAA